MMNDNMSANRLNENSVAEADNQQQYEAARLAVR
jgi:hypothetical protein